jgi:hypothetical protein
MKTETRRTLEEIKEKEPQAEAKVEALRNAIADAESLGNSQLTNDLRVRFNSAIEEHVDIFMEAMRLPLDQYREITKAMETRRPVRAA